MVSRGTLLSKELLFGPISSIKEQDLRLTRPWGGGLGAIGLLVFVCIEDAGGSRRTRPDPLTRGARRSPTGGAVVYRISTKRNRRKRNEDGFNLL